MLDFTVTFFITIFNIAVLFFLLRFLLFKPVTKFMADRAKRVQDSIDQSEKDKTLAKAMLAKYEDQLRTADAEAKAIIDSAKEHAREEAEKIIAESKASAETAMEKARGQIQTERQVAMAAFREEAAVLVTAASGRLLDREINTADNQRFALLLLKEATSLKETTTLEKADNH